MGSFLTESGGPLMPLQVDIPVWKKRNALFPEPRFLLIEKRGRPPRMIDHPVTGIVSVVFRHAQNLPHEPRIPVPSDQPGNLAVCGDPAPGNFLHNGEDFIDQMFIQNHLHGSFLCSSLPCFRSDPPASGGKRKYITNPGQQEDALFPSVKRGYPSVLPGSKSEFCFFLAFCRERRCRKITPTPLLVLTDQNTVLRF